MLYDIMCKLCRAGAVSEHYLLVMYAACEYIRVPHAIVMNVVLGLIVTGALALYHEHKERKSHVKG